LGADVTAALRFMDAHLTEDLAIGTLAAACNVSPNTLERHFQEAFHMTPFAVLRRRRLFRSMELLRNGYSVAEAARESGFSDYSHYIQLFKKQFGITPLHYKKKFRPSQPKM
jgi:transcriptional regulator GlxA family with amidase domain